MPAAVEAMPMAAVEATAMTMTMTMAMTAAATKARTDEMIAGRAGPVDG